MKKKHPIILTMNDILREHDPFLRKKTKSIPLPLAGEDLNRAESMMIFLKNSQDKRLREKYGLREGMGLAANQIGWDKQVFAVYFTDEQNQQLEYILCNPKIIDYSSSAIVYLEGGEGCLSVDREVKG
jgi:peptide deformylase